MNPLTHEQRKQLQRNSLRAVSLKTRWGGASGVVAGNWNQFYLWEICPLILPQLQITYICSVRTGVFYLISGTSQWNNISQSLKRYGMTMQSTQWRSEARTQENHKQDHDGPHTSIDTQTQTSETD